MVLLRIYWVSIAIDVAIISKAVIVVLYYLLVAVLLSLLSKCCQCLVLDILVDSFYIIIIKYIFLNTYWRTKILRDFSAVSVLHFKYRYGDQFWQIYEKARKVQYTTLKPTISQSVREQDHINERSNPISQTTYATIHSM